MEKLYKIVPKAHLPKDYGGDLQPLAEIAGKFRVRINEFHIWFIHQMQQLSGRRKWKITVSGSWNRKSTKPTNPNVRESPKRPRNCSASKDPSANSASIDLSLNLKQIELLVLTFYVQGSSTILYLNTRDLEFFL